jgi:hypothetical protein
MKIFSTQLTIHLFLAFIMVSAIACSSQIDVNKSQLNSTLSKENIKGKVRVISYNRGNNIDYRIFDINGNDSIEFVGSYETKLNEKTFYYNQSRLVKIISNEIDKSGSTQSKTTEYTYNNNNSVIIKNGDMYNLKIYDSNNNLVKDSLFSTSNKNFGVTVYNFYTSNRLDSTSSSFFIGDFVNKNCKKYFYVNEELDQEISNDCSKSGESEITKYSYENLDKNGNWTKQRIFINGKLDRIIYRELFYEGDDLSYILKEKEALSQSFKSNTSESSTSPRDYNTNEDYKSNNETFQPRVETQTELPRQWINCRPCQGRGEIICNECNGTTLSFCGSCSGRGTFNGKICYLCNGALKLKCTKCYGKGNLGRCTSCGGRGQVQR